MHRTWWHSHIPYSSSFFAQCMPSLLERYLLPSTNHSTSDLQCTLRVSSGSLSCLSISGNFALIYAQAHILIILFTICSTTSHLPLRITSMSVMISLSATVTLVCLFSPKLYIIIVRPERNVRQVWRRKTLFDIEFWSIFNYFEC